MNSHVHDADVVVVGAGFAGITAARELQRMGLTTLVLEARSRIGGRTWTDEFAGEQVELGGMYAHWFQPHLYSEMTRYGIDYVTPPKPVRWIYLADNTWHEGDPDETMAAIGDISRRYTPDPLEYFPQPFKPLKEIERLRNLDALSIEDQLDKSDLSAKEKDMLSAVLATVATGPISRAALTSWQRWLALSGYDLESTFEACGTHRINTKSLADAIFADSGASLRLSTPVIAIENTAGGVKVSSRIGEVFTARVAVVAVPMNTLRNIEFGDALPPQRIRVENRTVGGSGGKLWVHVRGQLDPFYLTQPAGHAINFLDTQYVLDNGDQLLVAFSEVADLDGNDVEAVREAVGPLLPAHVEIVASRGHNWVDDEFALGTWAMYEPNHLTREHALMREPFGNVFFAGADIADGWNGFIDGAIQTGHQAARAIRSHLCSERKDG